MNILFVCHGNICRSVMAEYMMRCFAEREWHRDDLRIDSKAAHTDDLGREMYPPAKRKLKEKGIPFGRHRAELIGPDDYRRYDLLIGMDGENIRDMTRRYRGDPEGKIRKLMSFAGSGRDVVDPWYTDDFETAYRDLDEGIHALMRWIQRSSTLRCPAPINPCAMA